MQSRVEGDRKGTHKTTTAMRKSFVFYASWWEAIKNLPREIQGEVLTAIVEYGLSGETTESLKPIAKALLALVKPQIDANNQKFNNGTKGGRPKEEENQTETKQEPNRNQTKTKQKPNENQTETKQEPNRNQTETKQEPNEECYNEECYNDIKENTPKGVQKKAPPTPYENFLAWMRENTPNVLKLKSQVSEVQYAKLREKYSHKQLVDILLAMENYKELTKKYNSVYLTFLKWAKKAYGTD